MSSFREISEALRAARGSSAQFVLATIVRVAGSTYRRPGARMLIAADRHIGAISGGCLEDEVCRRAFWRTENGPAVVSLDTGLEEDGGYGVGCRGIVTLLLERLRGGDVPTYLHALCIARERGEYAALATVIGGAQSDGPAIGARAWLAGGALGGDAGLISIARDDIAAGFTARSGGMRRYLSAGGEIEVFIEVAPPPVSLVVFGGGYDVAPLFALARTLGWRSTAAARRPQSVPRERVANADALSSIDDFFAVPRIPERTAVVVMTHNFVEDQRIVERLASLAPAPAYIGLLGPRTRSAELLTGLQIALPPTLRERVHAPIGLDVGAETPEQIALAIVAEIQAALNDRTGGFLRDAGGPLHVVPVVSTAAATERISTACPRDGIC